MLRNISLGAAALLLTTSLCLAQSPRLAAPARPGSCPEGRTMDGSCVPSALAQIARETAIVLHCRASIINPCAPVSQDYQYGQQNNPLHRQSNGANYYLYRLH